MDQRDTAAGSDFVESAPAAALLKNLMEYAPIGMALVGMDRRVRLANRAYSTMFGYEPGEMIGVGVGDLVSPDEVAGAGEQLGKLAAGEIEAYQNERSYRRKDGSVFWGRVSASVVRNDRSGRPAYLVLQVEDIHQQKLAESALRESERRWSVAMESAGQGVWDHDFRTGRVFHSRMWRLMRGMGPEEEVVGGFNAWIARIHPDDRERIIETVKKQDSGEIPRNAFEYRERRRDGRYIWILSRGGPVEWFPDGKPSRIVGTDTDITKLKDEEARQAEEAAETFRQNLAKIEKAHQAAEVAQQLALSLARHDALTGLPNRRVFSEALETAVARSGRGGNEHAILIIDLDRFKPVNDIHGHAMGDAVLCEVARRLKQVVRSTDTVARLGGDEFAVVLECTPPLVRSGEAAALLAQRIIDLLEQPIAVDDKTIEVGASIGISTCPSDGRDSETLLRAADLAMYRAKQAGRGTFCFFQASMEEELRARASLEKDVREAVARNEIRPHYQPLIHLADNRLTGFEILARWNHASRGDVPPDVFIPVVEQLGLIAGLTYSLLRQACLDASNWPADITIALNLSPHHLGDPLLPVKLLAILSEMGFAPSRLEIEITETAVTENVATAQAALATLRDLGIKIALDDFGTGYSSLHQLRQFRFDRIKIDRSFVQSMEDNVEDGNLVRSIIDLAKNLGLPTVTEGIEHLKTLKQIVASGGEYGQGFYFSRAVPAGEADRLVQASIADRQAPAAKRA